MTIARNAATQLPLPVARRGETDVPALSLVIPVYNEADNIEPLYRDITAALEALGRSYEVIIIDDGSSDSSFEALRTVHQRDARWRAVQFRRNFGQTAALAAGFDMARGDVVVTIDADLQNDPTDIGRLLDKMDEGYDIVSGWRVNRKEPLLTRRIPSQSANWLISRTTGIHLHDYGCSLKAYQRDVVQNVRLYGELHRFVPALASHMGVRVAEIPVNDRPRLHGKSKYGLNRTFKVFLDLIGVTFTLAYFNRPLRIFGGIGVLLGGIGTLIMLYLGYVRLVLGQDIGNRPLLVLGMLLMVLGVQMVSTGLIADMLMRTYYESQDKPIYFVRERLDTSADRQA